MHIMHCTGVKLVFHFLTITVQHHMVLVRAPLRKWKSWRRVLHCCAKSSIERRNSMMIVGPMMRQRVPSLLGIGTTLSTPFSA